MLCWRVCHAPPQQVQLVWCSTFVFVTMWRLHWSNSNGCQLQAESSLNTVYAPDPSRSSTAVPGWLCRLQLVNTSSTRHLRSSDTTDYLRHTTRTKFGERGFSYSGPATWNSLPPHLRIITDTNNFKRHLKSFLFTESFLLALRGKLYCSAIQITDCIVSYCLRHSRNVGSCSETWRCGIKISCVVCVN